MSIAIIKIKDQEIPMLKKFINAFTGAKMRVINNEDYQEELMSKLIEEGLKSKIMTEEQVKKEFKKHGVNY
jgi:hypothetical protein